MLIRRRDAGDAMPRELRRAIGLGCTAATVAGAYVLDANPDPTLGYALLLAGAAGLVALRVLPEPNLFPRRPAARRLRLALVALLLVMAVGLATYTTLTVLGVSAPNLPPVTGVQQIALWVAAGACCVMAAHLWDTCRHPLPFVRIYDRYDWAIAAGLVAFAAVARIANLATDPPGLAPDESWPLARTLELLKSMNRGAFSVDDFAMSGLYHYVVGFFLTYGNWLGLDTVQTAKLPNALFGALVVGVLFLTVRVFAPRAVAATAGLFLVWLGWPWILSRLYYLYSGDLLWIGLTTWLIAFGFTTERMSLLAAAGFAAAVGAAWFKTALLAAPWAVVMCADFVFLRPSVARRRVLLPALCFLTLALSVAPVVTQVARQSTALWRFTDVSTMRDRLLAEYGLSSAAAYFRGTVGAFTVLQVHEAPLGRHVVRLGHPALDVVTSALATVGALWCLWHARRQRGARLALLGFALFLWPAISSFPADAGPAVSRRMVGSAFFVAWLAGCGAAVVAERTVGAQRRTALMLALGAASIALNVYYIRTSYNTRLFHWHEEFGVNRVYLIRALREAAGVGPVFFHPTRNTELASWGVVDLPNVRFVRAQEDLRQAIRDGSCAGVCTIILPWPSAFEDNDTPAWIAQLSDLIPPYAWAFGPSDPLGIPLYRRAELRATPVPPH